MATSFRGDVITLEEGDPPLTIIEAGDLEGLARLIEQGAVLRQRT